MASVLPRSTGVLLTCLVLGAQSCARAPVVVAREPLDIGPSGVVLAARGGLAAPGPRHEITIELPPGYELAHNSLSELRGPHGETVVVRAFLVDRSGARWDFGRQGYSIGQGMAIVFAMDRDSLPGRRIDRLELSANVPFKGQRILWWSGDPGSRCFSCM